MPKERKISSSNTDETYESKLIGLELLRFLSAVAVLIWHYQHFWYVGGQAVSFDRTAQPLYRLLSVPYEWGVYGVQVFWMISGFIFFYKYANALRSRTIGGWRFFILRFSRLYPLHIVTFGIVAVLQYKIFEISGTFFVYQENDALHAVLQIFMASNWGIQRADSFNGPIWSVSLEVLVYGVFFIFATYMGKNWWATILVALLGALAYQLRLGQIFQCIFCFYAGGIVANLFQSSLYKNNHRIISLIACVYVVCAAAIFNMSGAFDFKLGKHFFIATVAPALILFLASPFQLNRRWQKYLAVIGNTTYSSYLLHFPLQLLVIYSALVFDWRIPRESSVFLFAYLVTSFSIGIFTFRFFEAPVQEWIRRLLLRQGSDALQSASEVAKRL